MDCTNSISDENVDKDINYEDALTYWKNIPPTVDGMLGGFGFISSIDIQGSEQFLKTLFQLKTPPGNEKALDCGAGIGRITKHLLVKFFNKVDLVEPIKAFIDESSNYIKNNERIGDLYNVGLQDFKPFTKYDVIWCQWVLSHLTNPDLVDFFRTCRQPRVYELVYSKNKVGKAQFFSSIGHEGIRAFYFRADRENLKPNGVIVIKENLSSSQEGDMDDVDSSRTRHEAEMKELFISGGLRIVKESVQSRFPKGLFRVKMYALRPDNTLVISNT